jgi:hypothetical protein
MEVLLGVLIGILGLLGIALSRLITTFIHESGHALCALLLTGEPVQMYVGSYGDEEKSIKLKLGRLTMFLSFITWDLDIGLCKSSSKTSTLKAMIIAFSGPFLSLVLGLTFLYLLTLDNFTDTQKFLISVLMVSSIWDFFINLIPRSTPVSLFDGSEVYNDGRQIIELFKMFSAPEELIRVNSLQNEGKYDEALSAIDYLIKLKPKSDRLYEKKLDVIIDMQDDNQYLSTYQEYLLNRKASIKYIVEWAKVKIRKHDYDEVISTLTNLIYEGKQNYDFHFLRGKALVELSEYRDALRDFHALTLGDKEDPRALANRAYCQYRLGYEDEAIEDVLQAIREGSSHKGEIYFLAGIIIESKDEVKALEFFKKSAELKYEHHAVAFNISRLEKFK